MNSRRRGIKTCGVDGDPDTGDAALDAATEAQNRAKNNFCAATGTPALMTIVSFDALQSKTPAKSALPWGSREHLPTEAARGQLEDLHTTTEGDTIGEGSFVQYVGFILEGHYGGPEGVNCNRTKHANADIHLALVGVKPSTLDLTNYDVECKSVTAEITPHFRPIDWDVLGSMQ